ncbi:hypothetical protein X735_32375 [Mesorhizobium sp. L2C085B000]|uniref:hypothetical protein n=1 Tax=Mesorhizobium sp. L2C085B000 TaxID=1287117 RepID=UPI0003CFE846|nr:hypothetical protein [Mesorhizobium sp. L2C085B000]ESZ05436.1 hypothetical protein X735_32375 [Mesorhizobium sp. L2C085B000]
MTSQATTIDRRRLLLGTGATAAALAAAASTIAKTAPPMSARERFDFHLAEMKKAATEVQPLVRFHIKERLGQPDWPVALMILGQWATGQYEGDGLYAGGNSCDKSERYKVKLLDTKVDGEREFSVINIGEKDRRRWMTLSEPAFESFIGAKVAS